MTLPALLTRRKIGPSVIAAAVSHARSASTARSLAPRRMATSYPLPRLVGLAAPDSQSQPAGDLHLGILDLQGRQAPSAARRRQNRRAAARGPAGRGADVAGREQRRSRSKVSGRGLVDRPALFAQARPSSGPRISRCAGFQGRSLKRCILPRAASLRRIVVGALSPRLAR